MSRIPLPGYKQLPPAEMLQKATTFRQQMSLRRTVRDFSPQEVPLEIIQQCLLTAGSAPSGANQQPWTFVVVSSEAKKREIRLAAEAEEREFYSNRAPEEWLSALAPLGVDAQKPFLETAPYLIAVFVQSSGVAEDGVPVKHYYPVESTGIATGLLIAALHNAGLATLTHTPAPMRFLNQILDRPSTERPFVLLVTGYPAQDATVPGITRKPLEDIAVFL